MHQSKPAMVAAIVCSLLAYLIAVALNAVLNIPGVSPFNETIGDLSHKYDTGITPSDGTFAIWGLIYIWQLVLIVYCHTLLCRNVNGTPLYIEPGFIPLSFFISYIINLIGNPAWIFVYLAEENTAALALLLLGAVTLIICLSEAARTLSDRAAVMVKLGLTGDIWATRILVLNGIALYLAWVSCATHINGVIVLHYTLGVSMDTSCWAALASLSAFILGWFVLETFYADRQLRYVFGHYIAYIIAFIGVYKKNYDPEITYTKLEFGLLIAVSALATAKLIIMIVRGIRQPISDKLKG